MTRLIVVCAGFMLLAGCGFDWFPATSPTFTNNSTVQQPVSTAKRAVIFQPLSAAAVKQ